MNETPRGSFGYRVQRAFTRVLVTLLVLGMAGAVAFLLAKLNARTFTLELYDGQLVVMKGRMLPWGAVPYQPGDARMADTYAPIPLEGQTVTNLLAEQFTERDELDRALFPVLETLAKPRIASDEPQAVERGVYYLRRAERLAGLSEEQRTRLKGMLAEVAYYQARQKLDEARKLITEAMTQLKLASEGDNRHSRSATQMLSKVGAPTQALDQALAEAVHTLSAPRAKETVEPPAETPPAAPPAPGAVITDSDTQARPPELDATGRDAGGPP
ncbi:IF-2 protein [Hyalangium rubrum]|uniref:IF-2 protein n=1 Tax=Hyalangium rubrum TaxID=3103134 RepID=A0ABU5HJF0_9BACT|nr:IF-2 protein [Hyalangium sp. s54d21]MDY7233304.1 IF-2 protein [Hyalangium sp. s54d21]